MDRRGFMATMLAACAAPAIVRAGSIMRVNAFATVLAPVHIREMVAYSISDDAMRCRLDMLLLDVHNNRQQVSRNFLLPAGIFNTYKGKTVDLAQYDALDERKVAIKDLQDYAVSQFPGYRVINGLHVSDSDPYMARIVELGAC